MKLRTIDNGDFTITLEGRYKTPYPKLIQDVFIDKTKADIVAVTSKISCDKDGRTYQGYHLYLLKDVTDG